MNDKAIHDAARAAGRFQLMANLHLDKPSGAAFQRDGQALIDRLWELGFRPSPRAPE